MAGAPRKKKATASVVKEGTPTATEQESINNNTATVKVAPKRRSARKTSTEESKNDNVEESILPADDNASAPTVTVENLVEKSSTVGENGKVKVEEVSVGDDNTNNVQVVSAEV